MILPSSIDDMKVLFAEKTARHLELLDADRTLRSMSGVVGEVKGVHGTIQITLCVEYDAKTEQEAMAAILRTKFGVPK